MSLPKPASSIVVSACFLTACLNGFGDQIYTTQGGEYAPGGNLPGDQVQSAVALHPAGGIVVWEDNFTDGDGSGISARLLDNTFSGMLSSFRVNEVGEGNQGKPAAATLSEGGFVLVWEGGKPGFEDIHARFLSASNTFVTGDILVNSFTNDLQEDPAVAGLANGESVVVWTSYNQISASSMKDVYLQRFSATGQKLGGNLLVNQTTTLNQRTPSVVRLNDGRFLVAWIGETRQILGGTNEVYGVDVFGRFFSSTGVPQGNEFQLNSTVDLCANPSLTADGDGGFLVTWSQRDLSSLDNGWDIAARKFSSAGVGGNTHLLNTYRTGDQFGPSAAALGSEYLVVWTSLRQDGFQEGVFGREIAASGLPSGAEFQVNSTVVSKQFQPQLASDGTTRMIAIWSGFTGLSTGFDVFGQRFAKLLDPLAPLDAPYVWALSPMELKVSWAALDGFDLAGYAIYADGAPTATYTTTNHWWNATGLGAGTTHSYQVAYVLKDGRHSPLSASSGATTYGGYSFYGVPVEWLTEHWNDTWPGVSVDSDGDGASNKAEFLAGTDPNDPNSVLRTSLDPTPQGLFLHWNTEPGKIYQVQRATDLVNWSDFGGPRFAPGHLDSLNVGGESAGLFRVVLLRN